VNTAAFAAWAARRRDPLTFRLETTDPDTGREVLREYRVPEHPARVWVFALLSDEPADLLLDTIDPDEADALWEDAIDPDLDLSPELLTRIGRAVLGRAADRPWWQVAALVRELVAHWPALDGLAADRNLGDPLDWSIERLCNWVYLRLTKNADEEERTRIDAALNTPPGGLDPEEVEPDPEPDAAEGAGWLALAGQFGVAGPDGVARMG
jgi:hypothetical protein